MWVIENGGRSEFPSSRENVLNLEARSSGRDFYKHNPLNYFKDAVLKRMQCYKIK